MLPISAMAIFCEDIREEVGGSVTLVGVLPDNINVGKFSPTEVPVAHSVNRMLSKLCIYARLHFDPDMDVGDPKLRLTGLGEPIELGTAGEDVINKTRSDAKEKGNIHAGVVFRLS